MPKRAMQASKARGAQSPVDEVSAWEVVRCGGLGFRVLVWFRFRPRAFSKSQSGASKSGS